MKGIPDKSVDMVLTSPPYDNLRDYKGYTFNFEGIAQEIYRVLKDGGVCVWIVGDATIKGSETGTSFKQALYFKDIGFNLHDTMIYEKANFGMPAQTRYHQIFEYMFVFSKDKLATFNPIEDKRNVWGGSTCFGVNTVREVNGTMKDLGYRNVVNNFGMRNNIWRLNTVGQENVCESLPHPAMFPERLAKDHILSWSNENDLVYDLFMGSGTTAKAAHQLKRRWIGSEISEEYVELANKRLEPYLAQESLF